jgi:hypothetical protein
VTSTQIIFSGTATKVDFDEYLLEKKTEQVREDLLAAGKDPDWVAQWEAVTHVTLVNFAVKEVFKGKLPKPVIVMVELAPPCGFEFEKGEEYLAFGELGERVRRKSDDTAIPVVTLNPCSRTARLTDDTGLSDQVRQILSEEKKPR